MQVTLCHACCSRGPLAVAAVFLLQHCTWDGCRFVSCCDVGWVLPSSLRNVGDRSPSDTV